MTNLKSITRIVLIGLSFGWIAPGSTQPTGKRQDARKTIQNIQNSIDQTNQLLSGSKDEKRKSLKRLEVLQSQISYRKELQQTLTNELTTTEHEILQLESQELSIHRQQQKMWQGYHELLKNKLIHRITYNPLLTLLSPGQMEESIKRWYVLDKLERERKQTLEGLLQIRTDHYITKAKLSAEHTRKDSLLQAAKKEEINISTDIVKLKLWIQELDTKESGLNAELMAYKKKKDELSRQIESRIMSMARKVSAKNLPNNIEKLDNPLRDATVISRFGKNMESKKSKLMIRNNGIDLQSRDPFVKVASTAEVVEIRKMPNQSYILITKSGELFIVYSNLENVLLRPGEKVNRGTNAGKAIRNEEGYYELHFETWNEKTPLDPLQYLK